jgi:hypothetical protein
VRDLEGGLSIYILTLEVGWWIISSKQLPILHTFMDTKPFVLFSNVLLSNMWVVEPMINTCHLLVVTPTCCSQCWLHWCNITLKLSTCSCQPVQACHKAANVLKPVTTYKRLYIPYTMKPYLELCGQKAFEKTLFEFFCFIIFPHFFGLWSGVSCSLCF